MQNILEAKIKFENNEIQTITVLMKMSEGDIRRINATTKPRWGYTFIKPGATISNELLQEVANFGFED